MFIQRHAWFHRLAVLASLLALTNIVCLPCAAWRLDELGIPQMVTDTTDGHEAAFTVSIDYRHGTTTGTSALDRAVTAKAVTDPEVVPRDFQKPGHVFPLRAKDGGVLRRAGHTEAAVDLATMAGMFPAGVICEVMNEDGTMARLPELIRVAREHALKLISIADLTSTGGTGRSWWRAWLRPRSRGCIGRT